VSTFERYLSLWVALCIVVGIALGHWLPGPAQARGGLEVARVNLPVAVLVWLMIIPMLLRIDFGALGHVREHWRGLVATVGINWLVKPFSMALLGWLFVETLFRPLLPADQIESYIAGLILLAAAPCTAMVFGWSNLCRGEPHFTLTQGALNDTIMVFAFAPIVESGWEEVLREAKDAGIPVILSDRSVNLKDDSLWVTYVGSDFMEEGRRAARWLLGHLRGKKNGEDIVRIVELQGTVGSAPAIERKKGFEETLLPHPRFRIVRSEIANFYLDQGRERMREILAQEKNGIDVLFAHNDDMALGAIEAIEEAGLAPGKDIIIVSVDAVREAFQAMIAGKLNCTVECTPLLGPQLMKVGQDYMAGIELPTRIITSEEVFPAEHAKEKIKGRRY